MKRTLTLALAMLMLVALFAGCSNGGGQQTTAATTAAATTAAPADATTAAATTAAATTAAATTAAPNPPASDLDYAKLSFWMGCQGEQKDTAEVMAYLQQQINEYIPNTDIEWTLLTFSEYDEKWTKAIAGGETIDIGWYGWYRTVGTDAADGTILAFDDYLPEYGQDILSYFGDNILDAHRSADGLLYFIPAWQGLTQNRFSIYIRSQVVDSLKEGTMENMSDVFVKNQFKPTLEAWQECMDCMTDILAQSKAAGTMGMGVSGAPSSYPYDTTTSLFKVTNYGTVAYGDESFTVQNSYASDFNALVYRTAAEWFDAGYIPADILSGDYSNTWANDGDGGFVFSLGGTMGYEDPAGVFSTRYGIGFDNYNLFGTDLLVLGTATGEAIPYTSKNPERAVMLLNLFFKPEGKEIYRTFVYGLEGKHYNRTTDNDTIDLLTGTGEPQSDWDYGIPAWVLGTCQDIFNTAAGTVNIYNSYKEGEKTAYVQPLLSFSFDPTDVSTEEAQIKAVVDEYNDVLVKGVKGVAGYQATLNEFLNKLEEAGMSSYMEEVQNQVNAFVAERGVAW